MTSQSFDNFYSPRNEDFYRRNVYSKLNKGEPHQQFRLLKINPCLFVKGELTVELIAVSFKRFKNSYTTLSYYAGDPTNTRSLLVNGTKFNAFATLWESIHQAWWYWSASGRDEVQYLWADQICINQSDSQERSHQVAMMGQIYRFAKECIVYFLSSSGPTAPNGIDFLMRLAQTKRWMIKFVSTDSSEGAESHRDTESKLQVSKADLYRVYDIINHPWWRRAWIQQEFQLSPNIQFLEDARSMTWQYLYLSLRGFADIQGIRSIEGDTIVTYRDEEPYQLCSESSKYNWRWIIQMFHRKQHFESNLQPSTKLGYLIDAEKYQASDPRDKLYAVLGLGPPGYAIQADYSKSNTLARVVADMTRHIIEADLKLNVMAELIAYYDVDSSLNLPSWAPDWTAKHEWQGPSELVRMGKYTAWSTALKAKCYGPSIGSRKPEFHDLRSHSKDDADLRLLVRGLYLCEFEQLQDDMTNLAPDYGEEVRMWDHYGTLDEIALKQKIEIFETPSTQECGAFELWWLEGFETPMVLQRVTAWEKFMIPRRFQLFLPGLRRPKGMNSWHDYNFFKHANVEDLFWTTVTIV